MTEDTQPAEVIDIRLTEDGATDGYPLGTFCSYGADAAGRVIEVLPGLRYRITRVGTRIHTGPAGTPNFVFAEADRVS